MSIFSQQPIVCCICGLVHTTSFQSYKGVVCSHVCWKELEWRRVLSIMGEEYRPQSEKSVEVEA